MVKLGQESLIWGTCNAHRAWHHPKGFTLPPNTGEAGAAPKLPQNPIPESSITLGSAHPEDPTSSSSCCGCSQSLHLSFWGAGYLSLNTERSKTLMGGGVWGGPSSGGSSIAFSRLMHEKVWKV